MGIRDILNDFHKQNTVNSEQLKQLRGHLTQRSLNLRLWNLRSQINMMMKFGKFQTRFLAFLGIIVFPYIMYEKYLLKPHKSVQFCLITSIGALVLISPMLIYRRFQKKLLNNIEYCVSTNRLILNPLLPKKTPISHQIPFQNISVTWTDKGRPKMMEIRDTKVNNQRKFYMEGNGQWQSLEVFKHLMQNKNL